MMSALSEFFSPLPRRKPSSRGQRTPHRQTQRHRETPQKASEREREREKARERKYSALLSPRKHTRKRNTETQERNGDAPRSPRVLSLSLSLAVILLPIVAVREEGQGALRESNSQIAAQLSAAPHSNESALCALALALFVFYKCWLRHGASLCCATSVSLLLFEKTPWTDVAHVASELSAAPSSASRAVPRKFKQIRSSHLLSLLFRYTVTLLHQCYTVTLLACTISCSLGQSWLRNLFRFVISLPTAVPHWLARPVCLGAKKRIPAHAGGISKTGLEHHAATRCLPCTHLHQRCRNRGHAGHARLPQSPNPSLVTHRSPFGLNMVLSNRKSASSYVFLPQRKRRGEKGEQRRERGERGERGGRGGRRERGEREERGEM